LDKGILLFENLNTTSELPPQNFNYQNARGRDKGKAHIKAIEEVQKLILGVELY